MKLFKNESENIISENNTRTEVAISDLVPFNKHPFKVVENDEMELLTQSIKENGIQWLSANLCRWKRLHLHY